MLDNRALERIVLASVAALDRQGESREQVESKISQLIPMPQGGRALGLVRAYYGEPVGVPVSPDCRRHLNLIYVLRKSGYPVSQVTMNWLDEKSVFSVSSVVSSLRARMVYPLIVLFVMVTSFAIMQVKVLPTLQGGEMVMAGENLEAMSLSVSDSIVESAGVIGSLVAIALFLLALYPVVMLIALSFVDQGRSPPRYFRLLPFMRRWMSSYSTALYLESLILIKDTVPVTEMRDMARRLVGVEDESALPEAWMVDAVIAMQHMDSAAAGSMDGVRNLCLEQVSRSVENAGSGYMVLIHLMIAVLVGYYVIAMYAPIWSLMVGI